MIKITELVFEVYEGFVEGDEIYINPDNVEYMRPDKRDKEVIHIGLISGETLATGKEVVEQIGRIKAIY